MDCVCGNPEGTNKDCERCRLVEEIASLNGEVLRLWGIITEVAESAIERTSAEKYHSVQISLALWEEITGEAVDSE